MEKITINHIPLQVKEYNGQRVVTFKDIDAVHKRPNGTAGRNFRTNRKHFIEGEDFYKITPDEFRRTIGNMDSRQSNDVTLLTETGYLMLVKSFTDDLAWDVQRQLVKSYFRLKDVCKQLSFDDEPEYEYFDKTYYRIPVLTVRDISHITGVKKQSILWNLGNKRFIKGTDYYVLRADTMQTFKKENPKFPKTVASLTIIPKSGFIKLCEVMGIKCAVPDCYRIKESEKPSNDILDRILKDFGIKRRYLTKENGDILLKESTITGNSVLLHNDDGDEIFYDKTSGYYEKLAVIMQNIGFLILGGFRESIDDKPVCTNEIDKEAKVFSATFLALKLFADYGGFDTNKN